MNACIIGYGSIAPVHANAITNIENAVLYGVCDNNKERLLKAKNEYPDIKTYDDYVDVLKDKNIDIIHICTPHYLHYEMIVKAMQNRKNVVCEKPVVMLRDEFEKLKKFLPATGQKLCCIVQNRENPSLKKLKDIVDSGADGELISLFGNLRWHRGKEYYESDLWRGKWATEGGGVVINQAIHLLDMLCWLGGDIDSIKTSISNKGIKEIEVEDTADAIIDFKNGVKGIFTATNLNRNNTPFLLEAEFENCTYRYGNGMLIKITDGNVQIIENDNHAKEWKSCWGTGHKVAIEKFYKSLENGQEDYTKLEDVKNTMHALFEFYM